MAQEKVQNQILQNKYKKSLNHLICVEGKWIYVW